MIESCHSHEWHVEAACKSGKRIDRGTALRHLCEQANGELVVATA